MPRGKRRAVVLYSFDIYDAPVKYVSLSFSPVGPHRNNVIDWL